MSQVLPKAMLLNLTDCQGPVTQLAHLFSPRHVTWNLFNTDHRIWKDNIKML